MKKTILGIWLISGLSFTACVQKSDPDQTADVVDTVKDQTKNKMSNLISIVEIPTSDFERAVSFYQDILNVKIELTDMGPFKMGLFPNSGEGTFVHLIYGEGYKPSLDGAVVYLNCGEDLQSVADKVQTKGGKIIVPKTEIGPEMGFYAIFIDSEENKVGLHSSH
jgi:uncharacterized protein